jgi:hypothetical protein
MPGRRWTVVEKANIVIEVLTTSTPLAEICRKYNPADTGLQAEGKLRPGRHEGVVRQIRIYPGKAAGTGEQATQGDGGRPCTCKRALKKGVSRDMRKAAFDQLESSILLARRGFSVRFIILNLSRNIRS